MKRFCLLTFFICLYFSSFSQKEGYVIAGLDVGFPQTSPSWTRRGLGITIGYEKKIRPMTTWVLQLNVIQFPAGNGPYLNFNYPQIVMIPILTGVKFYSPKAFKGLFVEFDGGLSTVIPYENKRVYEKLTFVPAIGFQLGAFELSLRENFVLDYPFLGLRLVGKF